MERRIKNWPNTKIDKQTINQKSNSKKRSRRYNLSSQEKKILDLKNILSPQITWLLWLPSDAIFRLNRASYMFLLYHWAFAISNLCWIQLLLKCCESAWIDLTQHCPLPGLLHNWSGCISKTWNLYYSRAERVGSVYNNGDC